MAHKYTLPKNRKAKKKPKKKVALRKDGQPKRTGEWQKARSLQGDPSLLLSNQVSERGRPACYTRELADEFLMRMRSGETLRHIALTSPHLPSPMTIRKWAFEDTDGFTDRYKEARREQMACWSEEVKDIADNQEIGHRIKSGPNGVEVTEFDATEHRKLKIESRKWLLSKLDPSQYGDKVDLSLGGRNGSPVIPLAAVAMTAEEAERQYRQLINGDSSVGSDASSDG